MDKRIARTKELGRFFVFTDTIHSFPKGKSPTEPLYKANYIDSLELKTEHIPTLRRVILREKYRDEGWEIIE